MGQRKSFDLKKQINNQILNSCIYGTCKLVFFSFIFVFFAATTSYSDLCVLKNGDYDLSSKYDASTPASGVWDGSAEAATPCTTADNDDVVQDQNIEVSFAAGEDIIVDIVFEQKQDPAQQFPLEYFTYLMFYDTNYMEVSSCDPDPAGFFADNMGEFLGIPYCENGRNPDDLPVVVQNYMNFTGDNYPIDPANYLFDTVVFENFYSSSQQNVYTFTFDTSGGAGTGADAHYNNTNSCPLFKKTSKVCDGLGIEFHDILTTSVSITIPPAITGPPKSVSLSCRGIGGCTANGGSAVAVLKYEIPDVCYVNNTCSAASELCENYGISFTDMDGNRQILSSSGEFSETVNVGDTVQYRVRGVETNGYAADSTSLNGCSGVLTTNPVVCRCGDPPVIKLVSPRLSEFGSDSDVMYSAGKKIEFKFSLDDPDDDLSVGLPDSITSLDFYYSNEEGGAAQRYTPVDLDTNGNFTAFIPGEYIKAGNKLYFGVVAVDYDGLETTYPDGFDPADVDAESSIVVSNIVDLPDYFGFVTGGEPYPSSFPFIVGDDRLLKIYFSLSEYADVSMRIYSMDGRVFNELYSGDIEISSGTETCSGNACNYCNWATGCQWDGKDKNGKDYAGNGMYVVNINARSTGNNYGGQILDYTRGIVIMR